MSSQSHVGTAAVSLRTFNPSAFSRKTGLFLPRWMATLPRWRLRTWQPSLADAAGHGPNSFVPLRPSTQPAGAGSVHLHGPQGHPATCARAAPAWTSPGLRFPAPGRGPARSCDAVTALPEAALSLSLKDYNAHARPPEPPSLGEGPPAVCRPAAPPIVAGTPAGALGGPGREATGGLKARHAPDPGEVPSW